METSKIHVRGVVLRSPALLRKKEKAGTPEECRSGSLRGLLDPGMEPPEKVLPKMSLGLVPRTGLIDGRVTRLSVVSQTPPEMAGR